MYPHTSEYTVETALGALLSVMPLLPLLALMTLVGALVGCEINYEEGLLSEELSESTPLLQLIEAEYTYKRTESRLITISAQSAESFEKLEYVRFQEVAFIESDREGAVLNSGSAQGALYYFNGDIELTGDVLFQSFQNRAVIAAPYLIWENEEQIITGNPDDTVEITRPSGTRILGKGLVANLQEREISLLETEGIIFPEPDEEGE